MTLVVGVRSPRQLSSVWVGSVQVMIVALVALWCGTAAARTAGDPRGPFASPTPTVCPVKTPCPLGEHPRSCTPDPSKPFSTDRGTCCHLARSEGGVPFSWCPAGKVTDPTSEVCTECLSPC
jgi:hypothetical protein